MDWLGEHWFWVVVGLLFILVHTKMHGGHGGHGGGCGGGTTKDQDQPQR